MSDKSDWVQAHLSKDELAVYQYLHRQFGVPDDRYRSSRLLEYPPEHYAEMALICARTGAEELEQATVRHDTDSPLLEITDGLMQKLARNLAQEGLAEAGEQAMIENQMDGRTRKPADIDVYDFCRRMDRSGWADDAE